MNPLQPVVDGNGIRYESISDASRRLHISKAHIVEAFKKYGSYRNVGRGITLMRPDGAIGMNKTYVAEVESHSDIPVKASDIEKYTPDDVAEFLAAKKIEGTQFHRYDFGYAEQRTGYRYAVALFSDAHIEEVVRPESVLGLNEYNLEVARKRIARYFNHLALCLNEDKVDELIFASLGDMISGYIHDELSQTNSLSPLEAIYEAQNLLYSGLAYLCEHTRLKSIKFIGICGNHSRTTKKIQHSNGYRMSYEWLMYKNLEKYCKLQKLPIEFAIPESELAIVNAPDGRRYIFMHGFQIKGGGTGTVCGIYPALNRLTMKYQKVFKQDKCYLGHFHSCTSIPNAVVNGSIIGYSAYSLTNGFPYEVPAQMYELYDSELGEVLTRKIYCE